MLPPPYQLDPLLGSYYSNVSGLFRGNVRYYNLSSIPYDTSMIWRPIVDGVMENANLSAIPERLGSWNWSAADTIGIKVHDRMMPMGNVSESIAIFQVVHLLSIAFVLYRSTLSGKIRIVRPRGLGCHTYGVRWSALHEEWLFLRVCSAGRVRHSDTVLHDSLFDLLLVPRLSTCVTFQVSSLLMRRMPLHRSYKTR